MDISVIKTKQKRVKRAVRVRKKLKGSLSRPRLCVYKSNCHIYAQIIDDERGVTLASASTNSKEFKAKRNAVGAAVVGETIAKAALGQDIRAIVFDRGPFKYHGVIKALADKARECGLEF